MTEITNESRALRGEHAVTAYKAHFRVGDGARVGDLLTDLMHWCYRNGIEFSMELSDAQFNYTEERAQEAQEEAL